MRTLPSRTAVGLLAVALVGCSSPTSDRVPDAELPLHIEVVAHAGTHHLFVEDSSARPCLGYPIVGSRASVISSEIVVDVGRRVATPDGACLSAIGPAAFITEIELAPGDYTLELRHRGMVDRYTLSIGPDGPVLSPEDATFSSVGRAGG